MADVEWEVTDEDLADQWESAEAYAHNFGLWLAGQTFNQRTAASLLWQAFVANFDDQPARLLEYTMSVAFKDRSRVVCTWN